jgi:Zn-dependent peptidase ImmA (M78 family)
MRTVGDIRTAARRSASDVLERFWPPQVLPVDPVVIARDLGLSVFSAELGEDVWGMLAGGSAGCDIYLDRDQPPSRYRFSCAHELGHFIDRGAELVPGTAFVDKRSDAGTGRADEIYANEFAGSLLMPEAGFRADVRTLGDYDLAARYAVSLEAVRYRRRLLGV